MTLTLKYRPQTFAEMVGQPLTSIVLAQMVKTNSVPDAILFDGPRGTGKTSAARILAMELNPSEREQILAGTSLSVIEIDAASNGSVADIRSLIDQLRYSVGAERRVVILDEAHSITREGFNALLKTLEEPPAGVVFVLVTTEPHKLPETILSRVMEFEFRRVAPTDLLIRLQHVVDAEGLTVSPELLARLSETADGSVRDAIKNLDFVVRAGIDTDEDFNGISGQRDIAPALFAALLTGDHSKIFLTLDKILREVSDARVVSDALNLLFADLFVLKSGGHVSATGASLEARVKLAKAVSSEAMYQAVTILWDLKTKVRQIEDQRAALSLALVLITDRLSSSARKDDVIAHSEPEPEVASEQDDVRPLTLSELQQS